MGRALFFRVVPADELVAGDVVVSDDGPCLLIVECESEEGGFRVVLRPLLRPWCEEILLTPDAEVTVAAPRVDPDDAAALARIHLR